MQGDRAEDEGSDGQAAGAESERRAGEEMRVGRDREEREISERPMKESESEERSEDEIREDVRNG